MELAEAVSLVIFYSGAFFMPLLASRIHVPASVAEILFGLLVGGFGLVHESAFTEFLAEFGFMYLMFLVGMEIDFNRIEKEGKSTVLVAFVVAASILGVAAFLSQRLGLEPFLGLVLGAMSVGVLLVALIDVNASQTRWGQIVLLVGSIGEFLTLMTLTGYHLVESHGVGWELAMSVGEMMLLFAVAFVLLLLLRLGVWWFPHSFQRWVREEDPSELGVRFGFVLMLGLTTLAIWAGLESILGAFLAGTLFAYVFRETGVLETKLAALGQGFFIPIFFIHVGVNFDWTGIRDLGELGSTLLVLAGASFVAKMVPSLFLIGLGLPLRAALGGALLLATPLTLLVAISALGMEMGVLHSDMAAAVVLLAIVTGVLFPTLFKLVAPKTQAGDLAHPRRNDLPLRKLHVT